MKLTRVTITGADDAVSHQALVELSQEYGFVEWGILMSPKRFGEPRYPSTKWVMGLQSTGLVPRCSYHMCGEFSRRTMGGDPTMVPRGIKRMQLNGFSGYVLPCLLAAEGAPEVEFILQCSSEVSLLHAISLHNGQPNIVPLWDPSGGLGRSFMESGVWYPHGKNLGVPSGYAGGINEHNIEDTIASLSNGTGEPFWIDLETGARTENRFDLDKVRRILKFAAPFMGSP